MCGQFFFGAPRFGVVLSGRGYNFQQLPHGPFTNPVVVAATFRNYTHGFHPTFNSSLSKACTVRKWEFGTVH